MGRGIGAFLDFGWGDWGFGLVDCGAGANAKQFQM